MIRDPFRFYRVAPPAPTYGPVELPIVDVQSSLPSDFVANRVRQGGASFMRPVVGLMGQPQRDMVEMITGVEQTPSEAMGISNPVAAFLTDAALDPLNIGVTSIGGAMMRNSMRNPLRFLSRRELMPSANSMLPTMDELGQYIDPVVNAFGLSRRPRRSRVLIPRLQQPIMTQEEANELLRQYNLRRYGTANPIVNKSGLDKDRAIALSPESKSMVESMSDKDFQNTVLSLNKGERKIVNAPNDKEVAMYLLGKNKVKTIPVENWIDEFNSNLSELNERIVPRVNRSGVKYEFLPMQKLPGSNHAEIGLKSTDQAGNEVVKGWTVRIKPGKFKGEIQDVAGEDYMNSIPGLQMTNSGEGVFDKNLYAPGSNAYRALNDYLKSLDLGRVSSGKSGLSDKGKKAWETHLLNDRAIGFANGVANSGRPDIYAIMRTMNPYIMSTFGAGYGIGKYYKDNNRQ